MEGRVNYRFLLVVVATTIFSAITHSEANAQSPHPAQPSAYTAPEACAFVLGDFEYKAWTDRYLDFYDKWFDTPVSESEVIAYQDEEAQKMGRIYRRPPWTADIFKVRRSKYEATYGSDLTNQEKSALLATGWSNTNNPLEYFGKITEYFRRLNCNGVPGGGEPPGLYFGAVQDMARECNKNLSASEKIPCTNIYLGSVARRAGNFQVAFSEFEELAKDGSPEAMFQLGQMYENGEGVEANQDVANDWYMSAAKAGHEDALNSLDASVVASADLTQDDAASENCSEIPEDHIGGGFRAALFTLFNESCDRFLSESEQAFVAGIVGKKLDDDAASSGVLVLHDSCDGLISEANQKRLIEYYRTMAMPTATNTEELLAWTAGGYFLESHECSEKYVQITDKLLAYLDRTSEASVFVRGCVEHNAGVLSEEQCVCMAEKSRRIYPRVHTYTYESRIIRSAAREYPYLGAQMTFQCQITQF
jgi:hypothetical protein